jgi:dimethylhistidine N-methyltransferase
MPQQTIKIVSAADFARNFGAREAFALDVLVGLSETRKRLPSQYMYDAEGSQLFEQITQLEEYYPTRCELDILRRHADRFTQLADNQPFNLIEFGAGSALKASCLIEAFRKHQLDFQYVPIDISQSALEQLAEDMIGRFPDLDLMALISDYSTGIKWLNNRYRRRNIAIFLGSSIGNFSHAEARIFLRSMWNGLNNGDNLIIGFDLKKDIELLLKAYNDPKGVTAEFNYNILRRINRELGGEFDIESFRHIGTYDVFSGAMESYLVSLKAQEVFIHAIGRSFSFRPWEPIHVEYSYKYLESDIETLAAETGFEVIEHIYDSNRWFIDSFWRVRKNDTDGTTRLV